MNGFKNKKLVYMDYLNKSEKFFKNYDKRSKYSNLRINVVSVVTGSYSALSFLVTRAKKTS